MTLNMKNIGQMRFIASGLLIAFIITGVLFLANADKAFAEPIPPKPVENHYVFDYAGIISDSDKSEMQKIAGMLDDKTGAQVVVVTVSDLSKIEIEDYALKLFRDWGIGDKEKNNGVLILANKDSIVKNQRGRIRIEVGYGLEGAINDGKAGAILDGFALPAFEAGDYSKGLKDTFMAASSEVAKEYNLDLEAEGLKELEGYSLGEDDDLLLGIIVIMVIFVMIILITVWRGRSYYRGGPFNSPFSGSVRGGGGFRGGGFGGFGGGSSGGFGGGRSGGGGASR